MTPRTLRTLVFMLTLLGIGALAVGCSKHLSSTAPRTSELLPTAPLMANPQALSAITATTQYRVTDLGVLSGGTFSSAVGISPSGIAVGSGNKSNGNYDGLVFSGGHITDLGGLGGTHSNANAINNAGQIVGTSYLASGGWHACYWIGSTVKDLGKLNGFNSGASAINSSGLIIGTGDILGGYTRGFTAQVGTTGLKQLSTLGGPSCVAIAVNDAGLIVGSSSPKGSDPYTAGPPHACCWTNGVIKDLGTLGGASGSSTASAVSSNSKIAGFTTLAVGGQHAATFQNGTITDLGAVPGFTSSRATGINASGVVVGLLANGRYGGNSTRGFYSVAGVIDNLNNHIASAPGWSIIQANAINDAGVIAGVGIGPGALSHAVLLTPQ